MKLRGIFDHWSHHFASWRTGAVPGLILIGLVAIIRLTGALQFLEWAALDTFMRWQPPESTDERIVIVGINETDLRRVGTYPLPDSAIAHLVTLLQSYHPRAIGLDLVRDLPVEPGHAELVKGFQTHRNLIGVEKVLPPPIAPPPALSVKQVGAVDVLPDADGQTRRSLLGMPRPDAPQQYVFSFPLLLAQVYLQAEGIDLTNGQRDPETMQLGAVELPRFFSHSGGYVKAEDFGVQILLNYRRGPVPFRLLSLEEIERGNFPPQWIRDRLVLIGITSPSVKDFINTTAITSVTTPGKIYGVEFHAHAVSQMLSAVKDKRPLLQTWSEIGEYLWLVSWGILGIFLGYLTRSPSKNLLVVGIASFSLISIGYLLLLEGWWIPVVFPSIVLVSNGIGLSAFYQYDRALKVQIEERQGTIDRSFTLIHNGPLQTLANLLRHVRDDNISQAKILSELESLNLEIRDVSEYLKQEALAETESLRLGIGVKLHLKRPLHELFYEVYSSTLERDLPYFATLQIKVRSFEPITEQYLTIELKRKLCQFLEEALCNVGKHALSITRLEAIGSYQEGQYILTIKDNGRGKPSSHEGRGTKQCKNLAKQLRGNFQRKFIPEKGTVCELSWPVDRNKKRLSLKI